MKIYGIYDRAIEAYTGTPFFQPTNNAAIRIIKQEADREGSMLNNNPTDFELWYLGEYNESSGDITPTRERIARVEDLIGGNNA